MLLYVVFIPPIFRGVDAREPCVLEVGAKPRAKRFCDTIVKVM
ncbi:hypothetical protein PSJ8397_00387 [Pseudooctadecabacter jejudonensis]|uniref:Uncharacterized protein n=1 Tax=Pseudooctadecabacter jejudonensis TaxID=1391910 RepID=A0A1Y5RJ77_9RHOB|nr:hypothetical protein PSJ8397_00387 [Pseudooctadecabacter jejudonensis]